MVPNSTSEEVVTITSEVIIPFEECPTCAEGDNRWIYKCQECGFKGCYDGVYDNGCYHGDPGEQQCPECSGKFRELIGKVGKGSVEVTF